VRWPTVVLWAVLGALAVAGLGGAKSPPMPALAYSTDGGGTLDVFVLPAGAPTARPLTSSRLDEFSPSWSPDGRRLAYRVNPRRGDAGDIWVMRFDGRGKKNLTRTPGRAEWSPAWSPDGRFIAYFSDRGQDVWIMRPDGTRARNVTRSPGLDEYPSWSPGGGSVAFNSHRDGQFEVYVTRLGGSGQRNLTRDAAADKWPAWSPDGRWIAFASDRDGSDDVFVMRPDGSGVRNLTRTPRLEESHPAWLPDGRLTYIRHGDIGPIEVWAVGADGHGGERLAIPVEPVFVFAWKPR
jgi:Tol biopolymer transport system component